MVALMSPSLSQALDEARVIICAGTGGVGKTTVSASLGVCAAQRGRRVLVLTIDPAKRLAQALGLSELVHEIEVPGLSGNGSYSAAQLHPGDVFDDFIRRVSPRPEVAERLLQNRLYRQLVTTISGSQEFSSQERLLSLVESHKFDLIVLDTPPMQHAEEFLSSPERIKALFQRSVLKWFSQTQGSTGFFSNLLSRGTRSALGVLEKLTGSGFMAELRDFFEQISYLQEAVATRSQSIHDLLRSKQTQFILVTSFDESRLRDGEFFYKKLCGQSFHFAAVIINRCLEAAPIEQKVTESSLNRRWLDFRAQIVASWLKKHHRLHKLADDLGEGVTLLRLPDFGDTIGGVEGIKRMAHSLELGDQIG